MEKNKGTKIIAIIALIVAVISLSLGFALFSTVLTIKPSAEVNTDSSLFSVKFSSSSDKVETSQITATGVTSTGASAQSATIEGTTISGLKAHFTKPGQSVTYTFYAYNDGELDAYLKEIKFGKVNGGSNDNETKKCAPTTTTVSGGKNNPGTASLVEAACDGIKLSISVGNDDDEIANENGVEQTKSVSNHKLDKKTGEKVEVVIAYGVDAKPADGDFDVSFGDLTLTYSTTDS